MKMKIIVAIWPIKLFLLLKEKKNMEYFLLLFSYCYENEKDIYYLFSFFSKDFKANNDKENLKELIDKIENIYQNKNDIINSLKGQEEKKE